MKTFKEIFKETHKEIILKKYPNANPDDEYNHTIFIIKIILVFIVYAVVSGKIRL